MPKFPVMAANTTNLTAISVRNAAGSALSTGWTTNAGFRPAPFSLATSVRNFYGHLFSAPGGAATRTWLLRKNEANDNVTMTFGSADTDASDTSNANFYSAGDTIDIYATLSGSPATSAGTCWAYQTEADNQTLQSTTTATSPAASTRYCGIQDNAGLASSGASATQVMPTSGTFRNLYCALSGTIASGNYTITLYKNGAPTSITATMDSSNQSASDTSNTVTFVEGDEFYYQILPSSPATARAIQFGLEFVPDTAGEGVLLGGSGFATLTSAAVYNTWYCAGAALFNATESTRQALALKHRATKLYVKLGTAPGGVETRTVAYRVNGTNSALSVTITGANTTGSTTTNVDVARLSLVDVEASASASAVASKVMYGIVYSVVAATNTSNFFAVF